MNFSARWLLVGALLLPAVACGEDRGDGSPQLIRVEAGGSIQKAVDRANSGDLVLVAPGTYHEEVVIDTPGVTLRG